MTLEWGDGRMLGMELKFSLLQLKLGMISANFV